MQTSAAGVGPHRISMASSSHRVIYAALTANILIATAKFITAAITGSSSMLAEGFHSSVDIGNSLLLLLGMRRSQRPADELHPFGHGKELYFWSFVVAVSVFSMGGVLSIWEGIHHIQHPAELANLKWSYAVLGLSAVLDGYSLFVSLREIRRTSGPASLWQFIQRSKDPTVYTVAMEDGADLVGVIVAFLAIFLGERLHVRWLDGAGSILIGVLLIGIAVVLGRESKNLLVGESASRQNVEKIRRAVESDPAVDAVGQVLTMQLGPQSVLVNVDIRFKPQASLEALESTIRRIEESVRSIDPTIQHVFLEASSLQAQPNRRPS
jgi:cation diffusion facilitator family transporter